jgi:hypothetical protein
MVFSLELIAIRHPALVHSALDLWKNGWNTHNWLLLKTSYILIYWDPIVYENTFLYQSWVHDLLTLILCFILSSIILSCPNLQLFKKCSCFSSLNPSSIEIKKDLTPSIERFWCKLFGSVYSLVISFLGSAPSIS